VNWCCPEEIDKECMDAIFDIGWEKDEEVISYYNGFLKL